MDFIKTIMILCLDNAISGLDFNPLGTLAVSINAYGVCLISDINTNDYSFHLQMDSEHCNFVSPSFYLLSKIASFLDHRKLLQTLGKKNAERNAKFPKKFRCRYIK